MNAQGPSADEVRAATRRGPSKIVLVLAGLAGVAVVTVLVLRLFIFGFYVVPSGSMIPALQPGDRVTVNRVAGAPQRGDILVFEFPENPKQDFVKRVIALAGDKLEIKEGHTVLNGWQAPSCLVGKYSYDERYDNGGPGVRHVGDVFVEYLDAAAYLIFLDTSGALFSESQGPYVVSATEIMVLGDNRNNSHDSRMWFGGHGGGVPPANIHGKVIGRDVPTLPDSMADLKGGFDACKATAPPRESTTPPPAR